MATEKLNARRVETVKADSGKMLELRDGVTTGLELRVMPGGMKSWSFSYTRASVDAGAKVGQWSGGIVLPRGGVKSGHWLS